MAAAPDSSEAALTSGSDGQRATHVAAGVDRVVGVGRSRTVRRVRAGRRRRCRRGPARGCDRQGRRAVAVDEAGVRRGDRRDGPADGHRGARGGDRQMGLDDVACPGGRRRGDGEIVTVRARGRPVGESDEAVTVRDTRRVGGRGGEERGQGGVGHRGDHAVGLRRAALDEGVGGALVGAQRVARVFVDPVAEAVDDEPGAVSDGDAASGP